MPNPHEPASGMDRFIARLEQALPEIDERTMEGIVAEHPETARAVGIDVIAAAVRAADEQFLAGLRAGDLQAAGQAIAPAAEQIGVVSLRARTPIEHMTDAVRIYQRISWEIGARIAAELELPADLVARVAEFNIGYADHFTRAAMAAYVVAASERGAELLFARRQLLAEILTSPIDPSRLAARGAACDWTPTPTIRVAVALDASVAWPKEALAGRYDGHDVALLDGEIDPALNAAYGPTVGAGDAKASFAIARRLAELARGSGPTRWEDHLATLTVTADPRSADELVARRLAPLDAAPPRQRTWLEPTLWAWLEHRGSVARLAEALHLHEQSARYRVNGLRELYGEQLDDPEFRFELRLALEIRRRKPMNPGA